MAISKIQVASVYLDEAICHYFNGKFFCAIHLAGAAEELFGSFLRVEGESTALDSLIDGAAQMPKLFDDLESSSRRSLMHVANHPKNRSKHMDRSEDQWIRFDPESAATDLIERAISNQQKLSAIRLVPFSAAIQRFDQERNTKALTSFDDQV